MSIYTNIQFYQCVISPVYSFSCETGLLEPSQQFECLCRRIFKDLWIWCSVQSEKLLAGLCKHNVEQFWGCVMDVFPLPVKPFLFFAPNTRCIQTVHRSCHLHSCAALEFCQCFRVGTCSTATHRKHAPAHTHLDYQPKTNVKLRKCIKERHGVSLKLMDVSRIWHRVYLGLQGLKVYLSLA